MEREKERNRENLRSAERHKVDEKPEREKTKRGNRIFWESRELELNWREQKHREKQLFKKN